MIPRPRVRVFAVVVALALVPAAAGAHPTELAPPATHSPLDPIRLAADFAPGAPVAPEVAPFEPAAEDSTVAPADSLAPSDSDSASVPPTLPAGPLLGEPDAPFEQPPVLAPILGALVFGALGTYGGGVLGYAAIGGHDHSSSSDIDIEEVAGIFVGASLLEIFAMPAGAHLGNAGKGSYWSALGGSALGYVATVGFSFAGPIGIACGLALQTALTVNAERRSAKRLAAERAAEGLDESVSP